MAEILDRLTAPGELVEKLEDNAVRCHACAHRCLIQPGKRGTCLVRFNENGILRVPWGYVAAAQVDPVEKKPFNHLLPGSRALTFGMLGCDFHCNFCQNWLSSQAFRDPSAYITGDSIQRVSPDEIVHFALQNEAELVISSYNEPLITSEWAVAIFRQAQAAGLRCAYVSNGFATPEVLQFLRPYLSAYKIDLKTMKAEQYRKLGGSLNTVLENIRSAFDLGLWVEVVTLVIPGFNDSPEELWEAARYLASVSPDIPWHVTAFHPDYRLLGTPYTTAAALQQAAEIGQEAGLNFVYAGNLPGRVGSLEDTHCPSCQARLIQRHGFTISEYYLTAAGTCPKCGQKIPGVWNDHPEQIHTGGSGWPRRVLL